MTILEHLFYAVLDQSWKAAAIVLVLLAIRRFFGQRLSPGVRHALWLFVALAIVIPGSLLPRPTIWLPVDENAELAAANTPNMMPPFGHAEYYSQQPLANSTTYTTPQDDLVTTQDIAEDVPAADSYETEMFVSHRGTEDTEKSDLKYVSAVFASLRETPKLLATLWCCGFALMLTLSLLQLLVFRRKLSRATPVTSGETFAVMQGCQTRMGIVRNVPLLESERIAVPILLGLLRPRIILPGVYVRTCTPEQLEHFFLHELSHLKRHDILCGWVMSLLCLVHWFNPLLWIAVRRMNDDAEEATDQLALTRLPQMQHSQYGKTLLSIAERINPSGLRVGLPVQTPGIIGIMESPSQLTRRIEMIAQKNHWKHRWVLLAVTLCLLATTATLIRFQYAEAKAKPDETVVATEADSDNVPKTRISRSFDPLKTPENPDVIPDGSAGELLKYVYRLVGWGEPNLHTEEERTAQIKKLESSLKALNLGLERVTDDEVIQYDDVIQGNTIVRETVIGLQPGTNVRIKLREKKAWVLWYLWMLHEYTGDYNTMYLGYIAELEANPADRDIWKNARGRYLATWGSSYNSPLVKTPTRETFLEFKKQVQDFMHDAGVGYYLTIDLLWLALKVADMENDRTIAEETTALCTSLLEKSDIEENRTLAFRPQAILNTHYLAEDGLQIQGKLFNGESFDMADYHGKPMLVVFWRSEPSQEEEENAVTNTMRPFPSTLKPPSAFKPPHPHFLDRLKEVYEQYHGRGLEIVGVCTAKGDEMERAYTTAESLPWPTNISDQLTVDAGLPSNEKRY